MSPRAVREETRGLKVTPSLLCGVSQSLQCAAARCAACLPDVPAGHTCLWRPRVPCAQTFFGKRCLGGTPVSPNTSLPCRCKTSSAKHHVRKHHPPNRILKGRLLVVSACTRGRSPLQVRLPSKVFPGDSQRSGLSLRQFTLLPYLLNV